MCILCPSQDSCNERHTIESEHFCVVNFSDNKTGIDAVDDLKKSVQIVQKFVARCY